MGLPGSGKTTLAKELVSILNAVWFNADEVREHISWDLDFSAEARNHQAKRMAWMCNQVSKAGHVVVADFVCPTKETRKLFDADYTIWINRIKSGRFEDTNQLFQKPEKYDFVVSDDTPPKTQAHIIISLIKARND